MNRYMTLSEIEAAFPSEWVLLADPKKDSQKLLEGGVLLRHSKDREEIDTIPDELWPKNFAVLYTGTIPDDVVVAL
jgi:hypothetical protein